jgi:hypothetical protein
MANKGGALNDKKLITAMREALLLLACTANQLLFYCDLSVPIIYQC